MLFDNRSIEHEAVSENLLEFLSAAFVNFHIYLLSSNRASRSVVFILIATNRVGQNRNFRLFAHQASQETRLTWTTTDTEEDTGR
ncbi:hypothetical protein D3C75_495440 [compost metagenome]